MSQRDRAIEAAADIARHDGVTAITSVAVGQRLGVTQSAIYRHIRDIDELRTMAIHRLVREVDEELASIVREVGTKWATQVEFSVLLRRLVDAVSTHGAALCLLDRWRYDVGELGEGIRAILLSGRDGIAALMEDEWRRTHDAAEPLTAAQRAMTRAHAQLVQDDILGVARLGRAGRIPGGRQALVNILKSRSIAGWTAFTRCMDALPAAPPVLTTVVPGEREQLSSEPDS